MKIENFEKAKSLVQKINNHKLGLEHLKDIRENPRTVTFSNYNDDDSDIGNKDKRCLEIPVKKELIPGTITLIEQCITQAEKEIVEMVAELETL